MYQVQYQLKQPKNTPNQEVSTLATSPYELKAMLQQKLSNLHILKSIPNGQTFYNEDNKRSPVLQVTKLKFNKAIGDLKLISPIMNHTVQDRYLINTRTHLHIQDDLTQSNDYPKKQNRILTPDKKNIEYFYKDEPRHKQTFWSQQENEGGSVHVTTTQVQITGKKLPPIIQVQVDKMRLTEKDTKSANVTSQATQSIFRPHQALYQKEPYHITKQNSPLIKRNRNKHQSNTNINKDSQNTNTQKELKLDTESLGQNTKEILQRSISTPFMNKKQQKLNTSRSNSPLMDKQNSNQIVMSSDSKPEKQRKLQPIQKKPLISSFISPVQSGQNTRRNIIMDERNTDCTTSKDDSQVKKKVAVKKKTNKPKALIVINPQDEKNILRYSSYRNFINKINFSNNICITSPKKMQAPAYTIYVGKGNNSSLLKSAFKLRWWWTEVDTADSPSLNMSWTQLRQNNFLELLQSYQDYDEITSGRLDRSLQDVGGDVESNGDSSDSDFERSKSVRTKTTTAKQLAIKSQKQVQQQLQMAQFKPANYQALKKIFNAKDLTQLVQFMEKSGFKDTIQVFSDCTEQLLQQMKQIITTQRLNSKDFKMHNHLENNWNLSNKKALFYNMRAYYETSNEDYSKYLPLTFHIKQGVKDKEYERYVEYYNNRNEEIKELKAEKQKANGQTSLLDRRSLSQKQKDKVLRNIWIVKPGENTNRGTGISVCADLSEITQLIQSDEVHPNGKLKTYIVQQYIDNPFLYNKRKFDMRCYMLMTSQNGILKGYWYQDGYIRTTSKEYSLKSFNKMIHLTNDAVQKKGEEYGKFESGNKISFLDFQRYLDQNHQDQKLNFFNDIYPKMKSLALDTIKSVYGKIDPKKRNNSFELFGLDFMIDDNFKLWLIEANTNPCLELSCPLLSRIIPSLVENVLRIAVDPVFPPPFFDEWPANKKQFSPDNVLENNKFELVFDELIEYQSMKHLLIKNANNQFIFDIEEMEEEEDDE